MAHRKCASSPQAQGCAFGEPRRPLAGKRHGCRPPYVRELRVRDGRRMTALPAPAKKKLGLVIDLDTCVGCHACAVACKEWNDGGAFGPLADDDPYGAEPDGVWFNRVHTYEITGDGRRETGDVAEPSENTLSSSISRASSPVPTVHF